jgi:hypothetical protein
MAFPPSWPPRVPTNVRSLRFFVTGTATANFSDSAFMFAEQLTANPYTPLPVLQAGSDASIVVPSAFGAGRNSPIDPAVQIWSGTMRICATADLEFSFDGVTVHGHLYADEEFVYRNRFESGVAVRGVGAVFRIEAW